MTCCEHHDTALCDQGRKCPSRLTRNGVIFVALLTAFCIACAVAIAFGDRALIPY
jgi:hypothetical protein